MNIIVTQNEDDNNEKIEKISTDIICPQCKENSLIMFKDYKINLSGCKHNHNNRDIILDIYENTQKINLSKIKCNICKNNNKGNTHNNEFYICITCNINLCPLCKSIHDKNHSIINYDNKKYICKIHNESFIKYCTNCKVDICIVCEVNHKGHDIIDLREMIIDKQELLKIKDDLKNAINKFEYKISLIKGLLDRIMNMLNKYYKINEDIINNYNMNNRYYYLLQNLYTLKINNQMIIKDLTYVINNDKISYVYDYSLDKFYNEKGEKYIGEMKNGLKEGEGILYYEKDDGTKRKIYKGNFRNDKPEGKGIIYWDNGDIYEGDWKNGKKEGKGIISYFNGDKYKGDFKNNKIEGKGIYLWKNSNKYEGDFKNGKMDGKGIYYYNTGDKYEGDWKNGIKEGNGILYYKNGNKYEGEWKNGIKEGRGILYHKNGKVQKGVWKKNEFYKKE